MSQNNLRKIAPIILVFSLVSMVQGFGYDQGEPLPNVTSYSVYDVTGLSTTEKRTSGELVHQGLNQTVILNHSSNSEYRFSFEVENDGASEWLINSTDVMEHRNVKSTWNIDEAYYNISSDLKFGYSFNNENLSWDTSNQGSLDVGESLQAEYIVEIPDENTEISQEFFVNDSKAKSGSRDNHKLKTNDIGELNITMHEPPNNTVYQINKTFDFNISAECTGGKCGNITFDSRYNASGDEKVPVQDMESEPFYITNEARTETCDNLSSGEKCKKGFIVNATGEEGSRFNVDVNASSNYEDVGEVTSNESLIGLNSFILMGLNWTEVEFGYLEPGYDNAVSRCNDPDQNCSYNVVIENYSIGVDNLWIKGTDLNSVNYSDYEIGVTNMSYSLENNISTEKTITKNYQKVASDLDPGTILSTYYWLDVPTGIIEDWYRGQITFKANNTG